MGEAIPPGKTDRRVYPRYPLAASGKAERLVPPSGSTFHVSTTDISLGGLRIHLPPEPGRDIHANDIIALVFDDPAGGPPVRLRTRVVWIRRAAASPNASDPGHPGVPGEWTAGVEYADTPKEEVQKILAPAEFVAGERG